MLLIGLFVLLVLVCVNVATKENTRKTTNKSSTTQAQISASRTVGDVVGSSVPGADWIQKLPYTESNLIRYYRGTNGKECTCLNINSQTRRALFRSFDNPSVRYCTNLAGCTCPDTAFPCKHMFYLAHSLGLLDAWEKDIPRETYNRLITKYTQTQYFNDRRGWVRDKTPTQWETMF